MFKSRYAAAGLFLLVAMVAPAISAERQSAQQLDQLDEIMVRGQYTTNMIIDAEEKFFALYNKIDKDDDYQISCGLRSINPGSMITTRVCVPGFITNAYYNDFGAPVSPPLNCTGLFSDGNGGSYSPGNCIDGGYEPPPIGLLLMDRREKWRKHMTEVVTSDPRLHAMASHLGNLHYELQSLQDSYIKIRKANRKPPARFNPGAGPRAL